MTSLAKKRKTKHENRKEQSLKVWWGILSYGHHKGKTEKCIIETQKVKKY